MVGEQVSGDHDARAAASYGLVSHAISLILDKYESSGNWQILEIERQGKSSATITYAVGTYTGVVPDRRSTVTITIDVDAKV